MSAPDPCDIGALLKDAIETAGITPAEVARRTGLAPPAVYRALGSPDTRPVTARRILEALGAHLEVVEDRRGKGR